MWNNQSLDAAPEASCRTDFFLERNYIRRSHSYRVHCKSFPLHNLEATDIHSHHRVVYSGSLVVVDCYMPTLVTTVRLQEPGL